MDQQQELEQELADVELLLEHNPNLKIHKNGCHFYAKYYKKKLEKILRNKRKK